MGVPADRLGLVFPWMGCAYTCAVASENDAYNGCPVIIPRDDNGLPAASAYPSFGDVQAHYRTNMTSAVVWNQSVDVSSAMVARPQFCCCAI